MIYTRLIAFIILLTPSVSLASSGGGIPWETIASQAYNFSIFALVLAFLLRKKVKEVFVERHASFQDQVQRADLAKKEAETKHQNVKERLQKLQSKAAENLKKVHAEAEEVKHRIVADAQNLASKLQEEAERTSKYESEKAAAHLRQTLLDESVALARLTLKTKMDGSEQKRLRNEFVEKIQVVR